MLREAAFCARRRLNTRARGDGTHIPTWMGVCGSKPPLPVIRRRSSSNAESDEEVLARIRARRSNSFANYREAMISGSLDDARMGKGTVRRQNGGRKNASTLPNNMKIARSNSATMRKNDLFSMFDLERPSADVPVSRKQRPGS